MTPVSTKWLILAVALFAIAVAIAVVVWLGLLDDVINYVSVAFGIAFFN